MAEIANVEYRVVPVTRYIVTRFHQTVGGSAGVEERGEYGNAETAYEVGYALAKQEHERLGFPLGDMRIIYPEPLGEVKPVGSPPGRVGKVGKPRPGRL